MGRRWVGAVVLGLVGAALAAGVGVTVTAGWLVRHYWPSDPGADPDLMHRSARSSLAWSDAHGAALAVLLGLTVLVLVAAPVVLAGEGRGLVRPLGAGLAALVAVLGALVGTLTTAVVECDQLALGRVATGRDVSGWWVAAFGDDVRFVLTDGAELSPRTYAVTLVVHLAGPVVAVVALLVTGVLVARARRHAGPRDRS